jgi:hypothetical protein
MGRTLKNQVNKGIYLIILNIIVGDKYLNIHEGFAAFFTKVLKEIAE